jgi:uncharacterized protein YjbI with pentapeptide repeats
VRPRVIADGGMLLLEEEILRLLQTGARGLVAVLGPPGAGKTTALEHLTAVLPPDDRLLLFDDLDAAPVAAPVRLVVYAARGRRPGPHVAEYQLAGWERDDWIEYLLAVHRPRCAAVMRRLSPDDDTLFGGVPELWRAVLDQLAQGDTLPDARRALHRHLETHLTDTDLLERARSACLNAVVKGNADLADLLRQIARPGFADNLIRLLRYPAARTLLASERVAADLHGDAACDYLAARLPRDLVRAAAALIARDPRAVERLHGLLTGPPWSHAMAASLLHATGTRWRPNAGCPLFLRGAYLNGIYWPGADLHNQDVAHTDLSCATLYGATLAHARAYRTDLRWADLRTASLDGIAAEEADLTRADLSGVRATGGVFTAARLKGANFDGAALTNTNFAKAKLTGATFRGADLSRARFSGTLPGEPFVAKARLKGADFTDANLTEAYLACLCLRDATWTGARFARANLACCDLEFLSLPDADFEGAWLRGALLTGTSMPGARFNGADLTETGLADIDWEGADLCGADLRNCTFHLGSSRSGLVGSPIACEGSRTGFYTDDFDEQTYKAPEEIRKANLCGADLRGAKLDGVDFYLVDLRGARYDAHQEAILRQSGAILGTHSCG